MIAGVLAAVSEGELVGEACAAAGIGRVRVWEWSRLSPENERAYLRAREAQAHAWGERAQAIADGTDGVSALFRTAVQQLAVEAATGADGLDTRVLRRVENALQHAQVQRDRLRIDTLRWLAASLAPRLYGQRLAVDATVEARPAVVVLPAQGEASGLARLRAALDADAEEVAP